MQLLGSVNEIISRYPKASDISKLFLCETRCLPILMYAIESINLSISQCNEMNSWWNSVYRKMFHFNKWDSVSELILCLERLDFKSLYDSKKCNISLSVWQSLIILFLRL